jgi:hypothetical protein
MSRILCDMNIGRSYPGTFTKLFRTVASSLACRAVIGRVHRIG